METQKSSEESTEGGQSENDERVGDHQTVERARELRKNF
jgi:hypothetical protein